MAFKSKERRREWEKQYRIRHVKQLSGVFIDLGMHEEILAVQTKEKATFSATVRLLIEFGLEQHATVRRTPRKSHFESLPKRHGVAEE